MTRDVERVLRMHDCALERMRSSPSAPRVEHRYYIIHIKIIIAQHIFKLGSVRGIKGNMLQITDSPMLLKDIQSKKSIK